MMPSLSQGIAVSIFLVYLWRSSRFYGGMKVAQISKPGADWQIVDREIPQPNFGEVRIKVEACGICHSDMMVKEGHWPGLKYPRTPGHEVAGIIDAVGSGITGWKKGQRVG